MEYSTCSSRKFASGRVTFAVREGTAFGSRSVGRTFLSHPVGTERPYVSWSEGE